MTDLVSAVTAYLTARTDADSAPPWARIMREDVAAARMRELLAACFAADVSLDDALVLHAPDFVRGEAERWGAMVARIALPAPVVLGPWKVWPWGASYRHHVINRLPGAYVFEDCYSLYDAAKPPIVTAPGSRDASDADARSRGWVLLDAAPLREPVALGAWHTDLNGRRFRATASPGPLFCALAVGPEGWGVSTRPILTYPPVPSDLAAHGPQTGAEGERLAMIAALALGFVEGA